MSRTEKKKWIDRIPKRWRLVLGVELLMILIMTFIGAEIYRMEYRAMKLSVLGMENQIVSWLELTHQSIYITDYDSQESLYDMTGVEFMENLLCRVQLDGVEADSLYRNSSVILETRDRDGNLTAASSRENRLIFWQKADDDSKLRVIKLDEILGDEDLKRLSTYHDTLMRAWKNDELTGTSITIRYMDGYYDAQGEWIPLILQLANYQNDELLTFRLAEEKPEGVKLIRYCQKVSEADWDNPSTIDFIEEEEFGKPNGTKEITTFDLYWETDDSLYQKNYDWLNDPSEPTTVFQSTGWNERTTDNGIKLDWKFTKFDEIYTGRFSILVDLNRLVLESGTFWINLLLSLLIPQLITIVGIWNFLKFDRKNRELQETRNTFLNAIAHELKTPAAVIKNSAECVQAGIHPEKHAHYLEVIGQEADHVSELVSHMLVYTRVSDSEYSLNLTQESVSELLEEAQKTYTEMMARRQIRYEVMIRENEQMRCDRQLMILVMKNFLSNAVEYCEEEGWIRVSWDGETFSIFNSDSAIPEEALPHIWEPLYRGDESRGSGSQSSGMGLAICASILRLHGASYRAENHSDGVEFSFQIKTQ